MTYSLLIVGALSAVTFYSIDYPPHRSPSSIPDNYESMKACEKQDVLWEKVLASAYVKDLPDYKKLGLVQLLGMSLQELKLKESLHSDFAPENWKKYLHRRGAVAKVQIVPKDHKYTGIFQGADCALLRLSLTYKTAGSKPVAPGLALKVLRDGIHSANISALVSLDGQEKDFNFFKHPMSNIVPIGHGIGQKLVHKLFSRVSRYPEELVATDMAEFNSQGEKEKQVLSPRQIFFVPGDSLKFSSDQHDVRDDFVKIPEGTVVYKLYLTSPKHLNFDYSAYKAEDVANLIKSSEYVADVVTTSDFIASEFGDDGIFFRHQLRSK